MIVEMEGRRKLKHQNTEDAKRRYRKLNNKFRRTTDKTKDKWWEEQCDDLEEVHEKGRKGLIHEKLRN